MKYQVLGELYSGDCNGIFAEGNFRDYFIGGLQRVLGDATEESPCVVESSYRERLFCFENLGLAISYQVTNSSKFCLVRLLAINGKNINGTGWALSEMVRLNKIRN